MQSVRVDLAPGQHTIHRPSWLRNSSYFDVPLYAVLLAFLETWQVLGCPYMSPWAATYISQTIHTAMKVATRCNDIHPE